MVSSADSPHISFDPPDVAYWHLVGRVEEKHIRDFYRQQLQFCEGKSHILVLIDASRLTHMTPEARRIAAEGPVPGKQVMPVRGSAVIGASFHFRVLGMLVDKAARVLNRNHDTPLRFFTNEAEARAWFTQRRHELGEGARL